MEQRYAVEADGIVKSFGGLRALDGVSLRIREGEIYGLLGPNGSGKTTLIRALLGLVRPDGGTVTVLGTQQLTGLPGEFVREGDSVSAEVFAHPDPAVMVHDHKLEPVPR